MPRLLWEHWNVRIKTELIGDYDDETVIEFGPWTSTDTANLTSCCENVIQFMTLAILKFENLTGCSFIAKYQSNYLRELKRNLKENKVIIIFLVILSKIKVCCARRGARTSLE